MLQVIVVLIFVYEYFNSINPYLCTVVRSPSDVMSERDDGTTGTRTGTGGGGGLFGSAIHDVSVSYCLLPYWYDLIR